MIIKCTTRAEAIAIASFLINYGAGFQVNTLEIYQVGPEIETGDDMWHPVVDFIKQHNLSAHPKISEAL